MNPLFTSSYKGRFPFKLATTSFIYPDTYVANAKKIGSFLDEIELLFFESLGHETDQLDAEIADLANLTAALDVSYNIHLPIDVNISDPDPAIQAAAVHSIQRVIDLTAPLTPTSYTLHVPFKDWTDHRERIRNWLVHTHQGLTKLLKTGIPSRKLAIETLDYPIELLESAITEFDLSICLDTGHLIINQLPILYTYQRFAERICLIHLHGARENRDHLSLDQLEPIHLQEIMSLLSSYNQTVCIEVFNRDNLKKSLQVLDRHWD
jgi:sugar phosphate isomerase/epimerase